MAIKAAVASGTFSTMTWYTVRNTPTIHASTNVTVSASANTTLSATFKANSTSDTNYGVFVYIGGVGSAGTVTFSLQEYDGVSAWTTRASQTRTVPQLTLFQWQWVNWSTPYTYTTTTAGYYRINAQISGATGTTSLAADSGGSLFAYVTPDDASAGTPGTGDDIWIGGTSGTPTVVTLDVSSTVGSRTDTTGKTVRSIGNAVNIVPYGGLVWDSTATVDLICRGNFIVGSYGTWQMGTSVSRYAAGQTGSLTFSMASTGLHGIHFSQNGIVSLYGQNIVHASTWESGAGTAVSPLVTSDTTNWAVNDKIVITAPTYSNHIEKFIKTVVSPTSYTLSNTAGGAESGITVGNYTAGTSLCLNITRNVKVTSDNSTYSFFVNGDNNTTTTNMLLDSVQCSYWEQDSNNDSNLNMTECTFYDSSLQWASTQTDFSAITISNIISVRNTSSSVTSTMVVIGSGSTGREAKSITINGLYVVGSSRNGIYFNIISGILSNIYVHNCNKGELSSSSYQPMVINKSFVSSFTGVEVFGCRVSSLTLGSIVDTSITNGKFTSTVSDLMCSSGSFCQVLFSNCLFNTAILFDTNNPRSTLVNGSEIRFTKLDQTANSNFVYYKYGIFNSTGYSLTDTTVWTGTAFAAASSGQFGLVMSPESPTTSLVYEDNQGSSLVGNCQNLTLTVTARVKIGNAAYYAGTKTLPTLRVTYDDGATVVTDVADASTDAQQLQVVFTPTTSTAFIKIEILGATDAASPNNKFYVGELIVAGPSGIIIDTTRFSGTVAAWSNGLPLGTFRTFLAPANMWDEPSSIHNITDSFGEIQTRNVNTLKRIEALSAAGV